MLRHIIAVLVITTSEYSFATRAVLQKCTYSSNGSLYYFGIGSNMLKSKVTNRGSNGTKIEIINISPGYAPDHRLAFNLRGFPPLEPAMAGIEPCLGSTCHGALIEMLPLEYEKVWISEGGAVQRPSYEEVLVDVFSYATNSSVKAIALRAATHARLSKDLSPSRRYMGILIQGAEEVCCPYNYDY